MAVRESKPYNGKDPFVFISYSHRDAESVLPVAFRMMRDGYRVWYDEGIDPGTEWDAFIAEHIENCGYFIAMISENYIASENCRDELNFARDLGKNRLLVYLEEVKLPAGMQMRLGRLQAIHKYTYGEEDRFLEKLYATKDLDCCLSGAEEQRSPAKTTPAPAPKKTYETEAEQKYRDLAEAGDAEAQCRLGHAFSRGLDGLSSDRDQAAYWIKKSAAQGHAEGMYRLGYMYEEGRGVERDYTLAEEWYSKAIAKGNARAMSNLGFLYKWGKNDAYGKGSIPQNVYKSVELFRMAAERGDSLGQKNLAIMYEEGRGVPKNIEEAKKWFRKAAKQGEFWSINALKSYGEKV